MWRSGNGSRAAIHRVQSTTAGLLFFCALSFPPACKEGHHPMSSTSSSFAEILQRNHPVTGNTDPVKDQLKQLGCVWSRSDRCWFAADAETQAKHAELMRRCEGEAIPFAHYVTTTPRMGATELTLFTKDHPRLLAIFAGACAAAGASIVGAHIYTTRDGMALDTLSIQREFPGDSEEVQRGRRIAAAVESMLTGQRDLRQLMEEKRRPKPKLEPFSVEPQVIIDNTLSNDLTVIEVNGLDRIGLLYDLADALASLNLNIASAHVATFGEKVVDVFYVMDRSGKKIESDWARQKTRERLMAALEA